MGIFDRFGSVDSTQITRYPFMNANHQYLLKVEEVGIKISENPKSLGVVFFTVNATILATSDPAPTHQPRATVNLMYSSKSGLYFEKEMKHFMEVAVGIKKGHPEYSKYFEGDAARTFAENVVSEAQPLKDRVFACKMVPTPTGFSKANLSSVKDPDAWIQEELGGHLSPAATTAISSAPELTHAFAQAPAPAPIAAQAPAPIAAAALPPLPPPALPLAAWAPKDGWAFYPGRAEYCFQPANPSVQPVLTEQLRAQQGG